MNHHHDEDEILSTEVEGIHQRLMADGASWQHQLPSPDRYIDYYMALRGQHRVDDTDLLQAGNTTIVHNNHESEFMQRTRNRWIGIIAAITVTALLIVTFAFIQAHSKKVSATIPILHVTASQGWVRPNALDFGKKIAFASNDPRTGYVCGNTISPPYPGKSAPIRLSVTRDGGLTWHELPTTPAQGTTCELFINPMNADDVIVIGSSETPPDQSYRSYNGGKTWTLLHFPDGGGTNQEPESFAWAGAALFVRLIYIGTQPNVPKHGLAVSVNGRAFTWADTNLVAPPDTKMAFGFALGTAYYVQFFVKPDSCANPLVNQRCVTGYMTFSKTSDNGASWTKVTPSSDLFPFIFPLADGHTLFGEIKSPYKNVPGIDQAGAISKDGGQTWTALPLLPEEGKIFPLSVSIGICSAPDGTIYATEVQVTTQGGTVGPVDLLALTPGASAWMVVTTIPQSDALPVPVISATGTGQPNAIWINLPITPGILYHAA